MGMTTDEFDKTVEQLYGKSSQEVTRVLGKPNEYSTGPLNDGGTMSCFGYEGVKDSATGILSRGSGVCFKNNMLMAQKPSHSF